RSVVVAAPAPVSMMNSRRFIGSFRFKISARPVLRYDSSMAYVAIDANPLCSMARHTPAHILIDFSLDLVHLTNRSVASNATHTRLDVRFVSEEDVGGLRNPINPFPGRLLSPVIVLCQFLDLWFICRDHLVTPHAL